MDSFEAIADPVRRRILDLLAVGPLAAGDVAALFPAISRPAVSRHLRVLREAGLVQTELSGRERIYTSTTGPLREVATWLHHLVPRFDVHLDALETEVYRTRRERSATNTSHQEISTQ